jgi:hypothetical protein
VAKAWSAVINAAVHTDVDRAESKRSYCIFWSTLNAGAAWVETGRRGIPLIIYYTEQTAFSCGYVVTVDICTGWWTRRIASEGRTLGIRSNEPELG